MRAGFCAGRHGSTILHLGAAMPSASSSVSLHSAQDICSGTLSSFPFLSQTSPLSSSPTRYPPPSPLTPLVARSSSSLPLFPRTLYQRSAHRISGSPREPNVWRTHSASSSMSSSRGSLSPLSHSPLSSSSSDIKEELVMDLAEIFFGENAGAKLHETDVLSFTSSSSSVVLAHLCFLWKSACFHRLMGLLPPTPQTDALYGARNNRRKENWMVENQAIATSDKRPLPPRLMALLLPVAHELLLASLQHGYELSMMTPDAEQDGADSQAKNGQPHQMSEPSTLPGIAEGYSRLERKAAVDAKIRRKTDVTPLGEDGPTFSLLSGSMVTCRTNVHLMLEWNQKQQKDVLQASSQNSTAHLSCALSNNSVGYGEQYWKDNVALISLLLQPEDTHRREMDSVSCGPESTEVPPPHPLSSSVDTQGKMCHEGKEEWRRTKALQVYFRTVRQTTLPLSLASSLLALPLPVSVLRTLLARTIHDHFNGATSLSTSRLAASAAELFSVTVHALLNNDLFFAGTATSSVFALDHPSDALREGKNAFPCGSYSHHVCSESSVSHSSPHDGRPNPLAPESLPQDGNPPLHSADNVAAHPFFALHGMLISDLLEAIPHWASSSRPGSSHMYAYYGYQPFTESLKVLPSTAPERRPKRTEKRKGMNGVASDTSSRTEGSLFFQVFARRVRWIPLLNKLCRVYTKAGRGMELVQCHETLLNAVPEVEVQWPCSFYVRVMGAVMDTLRHDGTALMKPPRAVLVESSSSSSRMSNDTVHSGEEDGWCVIRNLAERALVLYGNSGKDTHTIWVVLCKAALTLPPLPFSCRRLLEAYLVFAGYSFPTEEVSDSIHTSSLSFPPSGSKTRWVISDFKEEIRQPLCKIDLVALQQVGRLLRGMLQERVVDSDDGVTQSVSVVVADTEDSHITVEYIFDVFGLLVEFLRVYSSHACTDTSPSSADASVSATSRTGNTVNHTWWHTWWLEHGGFILADLWKSCGPKAKPIADAFVGAIMQHIVVESDENTIRPPAKRHTSGVERTSSSVVHESNTVQLFHLPSWGPPLRSFGIGIRVERPVVDGDPPLGDSNASVEDKENRMSVVHGREREREREEMSGIPRWVCGCGASNSTNSVFCAKCTGNDSNIETSKLDVYTCPNCREEIDVATLPSTSIPVSSSASFVLHFCSRCQFPHPCDQALLVCSDTVDSRVDTSRFVFPEGERDPSALLQRHCLLCGATVRASRMWSTGTKHSTVRLDGMKNLSGAECLFFHCGVFQCVDENKLFYCPCSTTLACPGGSATNGEKVSNAVDECGGGMLPRANDTVHILGLPAEGWQIGYHCRSCLHPRPELLTVAPLSYQNECGGDGGYYYMWQCLREREEEEGEAEGEVGVGYKSPKPHESACTNTNETIPFPTTISRAAHQCGQWNYSWLSACVKCGEVRIKSMKEPRMRAGVMSLAKSTCPSPQCSRMDTKAEWRRSTLCEECGLPHLSNDCPIVW